MILCSETTLNEWCQLCKMVHACSVMYANIDFRNSVVDVFAGAIHLPAILLRTAFTMMQAFRMADVTSTILLAYV